MASQSEVLRQLVGQFKVAKNMEQVELFPWNEGYSVAINEMDGHHKKIFQLINDVNRAMRGRDTEQINRVVDELVKFTVYHFAEEESMELILQVRKLYSKDFSCFKEFIRVEMAALGVRLF